MKSQPLQSGSKSIQMSNGRAGRWLDGIEQVVHAGQRLQSTFLQFTPDAGGAKS